MGLQLLPSGRWTPATGERVPARPQLGNCVIKTSSSPSSGPRFNPTKRSRPALLSRQSLSAREHRSQRRHGMSSLRASGAEGVQATAEMQGPFYLGIDFGTSGARASVIDGEGAVVAESRYGYSKMPSEGWTIKWESALWDLLEQLPSSVKSGIEALAIDGTSATTMLIDDRDGSELAEPKLYNEAQDSAIAAVAKELAPGGHTVTAPTSAFCKVLTWHTSGLLQSALQRGCQPRVLHQADWAAYKLHGISTVTDFNNSLKLGYDPENEEYPQWIVSQDFAGFLPRRVVAPGQPVAKILPDVAQRTGLSPSCIVCGGTTDSIAAFFASGLTEPGEAVTSLGSTMAIKMISTTRVDDAAYGIYSHRLGDSWLVGGASNTGGAVLKQFFDSDQLKELSERIDPSKDSGLDYYPLSSPGERFPVSDPDMQPRLEPRPEDDAQFLHGMLEGIARAEARGFQLLEEMGASPCRVVLTAGGGASNDTWMKMRSRMLGVEVGVSEQGEASYGAARLALQGATKHPEL